MSKRKRRPLALRSFTEQLRPAVDTASAAIRASEAARRDGGAITLANIYGPAGTRGARSAAARAARASIIDKLTYQRAYRRERRDLRARAAAGGIA